MLARASPLVFFVVSLWLVVFGVWRAPAALLVATVACNMLLWAWACCKAALAMLGAVWTSAALRSYSHRREKVPCELAREKQADEEEEQSRGDNIVHLIIVPNYAEDEELLAQTLTSLAEADGASRHFRVVLAMEAREGPDGLEKALRLRSRFSGQFQDLSLTSHPLGLAQVHRDGSIDPEVPGKASNLKFAVEESYDKCRQAGVDTDRVILTVADADCIFHPGYFAHVTEDAQMLLQGRGSEFSWSVWQAPQVPHRNFWVAPACSRIWAYIAAIYEFGGVTGTAAGLQHFCFSGYSLPLQLARRVGPWDGDGLAEDHHCFLRCLLYSVGALTVWSTNGDSQEGRPSLVKMRPVMLPVKSTSVVSNAGYCRTWLERWHQAKRHAAGVAELSYFLLAAGSYFSHVPIRALRPAIVWELWKAFTNLFCIHMLPLLQATLMLGLLTCRRPTNVLATIFTEPSAVMEFVINLCFAITHHWAYHWIILAPFVLFFLANVIVMSVVFLRPMATPMREDGTSYVWYLEHSGTPPLCGSHHASLLLLAAFDFVVCLAPLMVPYGLAASLVGYVQVCIWGNRTQYVTAAKALAFTQPLRTRSTDCAMGNNIGTKLSASYGSTVQKGLKAAML